METKNNITIKDIISLINSAIENNLHVVIKQWGLKIYNIEIENFKNNKLYIYINPNEYTIATLHNGQQIYEHILTEREQADLNSLYLDVKEYNANRVESFFNHFIDNGSEKKAKDIYDLDDE